MSPQGSDTAYLETTAITVAVLSGLFGIYLVLFFLSLWSTYRHNTVSDGRMRLVSVILFLILLVHFISRSLQFTRARQSETSPEEVLKWAIPLLFIGNLATTLAALLSDGVLAWRFYIIVRRENWAKWVPGVFLVIVACLSLAANCQHLVIYSQYDLYIDVLYDVSRKMSITWGWLMLAVHSLLTGTILWKFMSISNSQTGKLGSGRITFRTVLWALIESSFVGWVGLFVYAVCSVAGGVDVGTGFILGSTLPIFFGISQCLITLRLSLQQENLGVQQEETVQIDDGTSSFHVPEPRFSVQPLTHTISAFHNPTQHSFVASSVPPSSIYQDVPMDVSKERNSIYDIESGLEVLRQSISDYPTNDVGTTESEHREHPHPFAMDYLAEENSDLTFAHALNRESTTRSY